MIWAAIKVTGQGSNSQISSLDDFAQFIKKQRAENPAGEMSYMPNGSRAQYMYSMFSTQQHIVS